MEAEFVLDSLSMFYLYTVDGHELFQMYMTDPDMYATQLAEDYKRLCCEYNVCLLCGT